MQAGAKAIDLNFGCPAPTVNRNDGGATLLQYPDRLEEIIKSVREALPREIPVSAKLRLGWDDPKAIFKNAEKVERAGASWITIHGRTKFQGYAPPALWQPIGEVRRNSNIPVIANGDIFTREGFLRCQDETQCEHFMLGRGALANPNLAQQIASELGLNGKDPPLVLTNAEWRMLLSRFLDLCVPLANNENYALSRLKQWLRYINWRQPFADFSIGKRLDSLANARKFLEIIQIDSR